MEEIEYFVVKPSTKLFGGIRVNKNTRFDTYNDDKTIHQTMKECVLTTEITRESVYNGIKMREESKLVTEIPEGTIIVWGEDTGFIIPNYNMVKTEEAIELYKQINDISKPIEESNKKAGKVYEFKGK